MATERARCGSCPWSLDYTSALGKDKTRGVKKLFISFSLLKKPLPCPQCVQSSQRSICSDSCAKKQGSLGGFVVVLCSTDVLSGAASSSLPLLRLKV